MILALFSLILALVASAFAWMAGDLNSDGVTGNASLATPEMGAALVTHYGRILRGVILDALRFPLDALR